MGLVGIILGVMGCTSPPIVLGSRPPRPTFLEG